MIIDRFEGEFAIIELSNKKIINVPRSLIPEEAKEGDCLKIRFEIDKDKTSERNELISKLMLELFEK